MGTEVSVEHIAYIGLGSNLGDRRALMREATERLIARGAGRLIASSRLWETPPRYLASQPDFLNAVVSVQTRCQPLQLLELMLSIERALGRVREDDRRYAARTIDLDLLLMGDRVIASPTLDLPHPRMHERRFVLQPLCEVAAEVVHPVQRVTMRAMLERCADESRIRPTSPVSWSRSGAWQVRRGA